MKKIAVILLGIILGFAAIDLAMTLPYRDAHRLIDALERGPQEVARVLEEGADPNTPTWAYQGAWKYINRFTESAPDYPLSIACGRGDAQSVLLLLEYGADPALTQEEGVGWSAIESAILGSENEDCVEIVKLLLEYGADPERYTNSYHPAELAAMEYPLNDEATAARIVELVELLLGTRMSTRAVLQC